MEPPRSPPLAVDADQEGIHNQGGVYPTSDDEETIRYREFVREYFQGNRNNTIARVATPTVVRREIDVIDVDDDAPRTQYEDDDVVLALCQPSQRNCAKTQEKSTGFVVAQPMGMTFGCENVPSTGNNSKMSVAAAAADPLQLSLGTHAPAANHMSGYKGSGINLNLLPPEKKKKTVDNASPSLTTKKPYELPPLGLIKKKDPPLPFAPVILESSEVPSVNMAPAKAKHNKRRRYIWPASKVAKLDEKIEELRKEAHLRPAHRRPMMLIEKDIDELQGKKDEIHSKMLAAMREDDDGDEGSSSTRY